MYKDFLDKKQKLKWLSDGMKQALLPDYGPVNQRYGRSRLGKIAKEVGAYTDLMAGTQAGSVKPPAYVLDAVDQSIRQGAFDHYGGGELERELFTYITNRYQRWYGAKLDPATEVAVTCGAAFPIDTSIRILSNPGDEILIFDPDYVTYEAQIESQNRNAVPVPLREDPPGVWHFDFDKLEAAVTDKTKLLMISNANNPSSYMYTKKDCENIVNLAAQHDFWILNDQVSEEIYFEEGVYNSILSVPDAFERTVTCTSFSKLYNLSGFRTGFTFAPQEYIEQTNLIVGWATDGIPTSGVHAILAYMREDESITYANEGRQSLRERRDYMESRMREMDGVVPNHPQGLYWMWPWLDVEKFGATSQELAEFLLKEEKVYVRPGTWYGRNSEGHFRVSFCVGMDWIQEGMNKMERGLKKFQAQKG